MARKSPRRRLAAPKTRRPHTQVSSAAQTPTAPTTTAEPVRERPFTIHAPEVLYAADGARAAGAKHTIDLSQRAPDDVIEVTLSNGARLYTTLGQYLNDFPPTRSRDATKPHEYLLPVTFDLGGPSRAGLGLTVKILKFIGIDLITDGAELTATQLSQWYEHRQLKETKGDPQRLWRCQAATNGQLTLTEPVQAHDIPVDRPVLVFLHGTASSTTGSFADLWIEKERINIGSELSEQYGKHIYGFEHRTLTESPIENTLALLSYLPKNACVHLISHSRGGMIGELLCRGQRQGADPFTDEDIHTAYEKVTEAEKKHQALLSELNAKLKEKKITVKRFVRVACPTRGTSALDERMDRWLSTMLNVLDIALPAGVSEFYEVFKEFALALIKTRTKAEDLPGLQAMVPTSALVRLLNAPDAKTGEDLRVDADLHVIAGDIEGGPLWKRLGIWVTDQFYDSQHDLVVHTPAMYGGASRLEATAARFYFTQGEEVNHFSYFSRKETRQKLLDGLTKGPAQDGYIAFDPPDKQRSARTARVAKAISDFNPARPTVVLLPGIMGSQLSVAGKRVWLSGRLLFGALGRLAIDNPNVSPDGVIATAYADLIEFLAKTHNVVPFAYDWRLSLRTAANLLREEISSLLDKAEPHHQPVSILAHSMGGLLARVFIADHEMMWQRLAKHPDARVLMLGTPNNGSHVICQVLTKRERLVQGLAVVDMKHSAREVIEIVKRFPGLLEMLPSYQSDCDFFSLDFWKQLALEDGNRWAPPEEKDLIAAKQTRDLLDQQLAQKKLPVDRIRYIAGFADETPALLKRGIPTLPPHVSERWPAPAREGRLYFEVSPRGDGRVLWDSGIPKDVAVWYSQAAHGDLADHEPDFQAILDLLQRGTTTLLPQQPPAVTSRSMTDRPVVIAADKLDHYPDDDLLEAMALGKGKKQKLRRRVERFHVSVAHGNLVYARFPVAVGHYQGDTIISAEYILNEQLDGRLAMRRNLDLYPGPIGTCEVFLNDADKFPGAVVVGLGRVGELTPGKLTDTFTRGVLEFALSELERVPVHETEENRGIKLSTLLIGTTAGGLSLRDSLASLLRGVTNANRELHRKKLAVRIESLELLELWEDRAIEAAKLLAELSRDAELGKSFRGEQTITSLRGGRRRAHYGETPGWWERLQIAADERGELKFTRLTDRARSEVTLLATQRSVVEQYIDAATTETATQPHVARTLFELMLPNEIKNRASDERDVVLVLDDQAAQYPWELMEDGLVRDRNGDFVARDAQNAKDGITPLAVRAGLIRQRMSEVYRPEPRLSLDNVALVVGNPALQWPEYFSDLPGAQGEAKAVAELLQSARDGRGAFEVFECITTDSMTVVNQLFARPYKILHLAGHGVHNFVAQEGSILQGWLENSDREGRRFAIEELAKTPDKQRPWFRVEHAPHASGTQLFRFAQGELVAGMVIGKNVFLTPREICQMRVVPELVFINCCFCGKDAAPPRGRSQLAASLATQLIEMGVRAVIAAGWAVDDAAAKLFAEVFYREMLAGGTFGRSVHQARKAVYEKYENTVNTWGAYQCYGDPDYRLIDRHRQDDREEDLHFVSEAEALAAIENLYQHALTARESTVTWLAQQLPKLEKAALAVWPQSGRVRVALGRAYGEIDKFAEAIAHYEAALKVERADVDLRALEQLANLRARHAEALARQIAAGKEEQQETTQSPNTLIEGAEELLTKLRGIAKTAERWALTGSLEKRRAMIAALTGAKVTVRAALASMKTSYANATKTAKSNDTNDPKPVDPYYLAQEVLAEILAANGKLNGDTLDHVQALLQTIENSAAAQKDDRRDFWARANVADCVLLRSLVENTVSERAEDIVAQYRSAQKRGASPREWRSVVENLEFIRMMVRVLWPQKDRGEVLAALGRIYQGLELFLDESESSHVTQTKNPRGRRQR